MYDSFGRNHEMNPLCVLDFYVHESQQRKGYGKCLYDFMLNMESNARPEHIAIDKPSEKSVRFLKKHYHLKNPIPQVNNFVVFQGFFDNRPDLNQTNNRRFSSLLNSRKQDAYSASSSLKHDTTYHPHTSLTRVGSLDSRIRSRFDSQVNVNQAKTASSEHHSKSDPFSTITNKLA